MHAESRPFAAPVAFELPAFLPGLFQHFLRDPIDVADQAVKALPASGVAELIDEPLDWGIVNFNIQLH
jgi:hypothetical protein